jgi:hypothetical protein
MDGDNGWESMGTANKCCRIGGKLREVKRMAKVGEKVKIVNAANVPVTNGKPEYRNGDVLKIIGYCGSQARYAEGTADNGNDRVLNHDKYVVLEVEKEMRFKVGDLIKGTTRGDYSITNEKMTKATVIGVFENDAIRIRINEHSDVSKIGTEYTVFGRYFKPVTFTLSDLKPCMVAKIRDGKTAIMSMSQDNGMVMNCDNGCWEGLGNYSDTLESSVTNQHDIMEVYGFSKYAHEANKISTEDRELLFKREEPKPKRKMTIDEICKELGEEIEIVKGE